MNTQASSGSSSYLSSKTRSESCQQGDRPLARCRKDRQRLCSPFGSGRRHTGPFRGMKAKGGKDTHWSPVFNFFLRPPLAGPSPTQSHFPSIHTYPFELTNPGDASDFTPPAFLACFSCLLCDLPSPKDLSKLIQLPLYTSLRNSVGIQSFVPDSVSKKREEACLSKRGVMVLRALLSSHVKPCSSCFSACLVERCYINDRIFSMATFCYAKSLLPCWCLC